MLACVLLSRPRGSVQPGPQWCTIRLAAKRRNQVKKAAAMTDSPITEYPLTDHPQLEMERRQITEAEVAQVLAAPEQIEVVRSGHAVYQSRIGFGEPARIYLLRVFVDTDRRPVQVVTAYRTSRIEKYSGRNHESDI